MSKPQRGFRGGFRQSMSWLHTWTGLVLSVLLYFMFVTGSAGYFHVEITRWMQPELPRAAATAMPEARLVEQGITWLQARVPQAREWYVSLPSNDRRSPHLEVYGEPTGGGEAIQERLDPSTGQPFAAARATGGGDALYAMHYALHYIPYEVAIYIVGVATMFMLVALVTGVVVHKKIFTDFFTLRLGKGQRSWLDAHNLSSVMALPFMVVITYSGLIFYTYEYMPSVRVAMYGSGDAANQRFEAEAGGASFYDTEPAGRAGALLPMAHWVALAQSSWGAGELRAVGVIHPGDAHARVQLSRWPTGRLNPHYETLWYDGVTGALLFHEAPRRAAPEVFSNVMIALHEGHFAGPLLRWLYLASGLLGAAMIATGLVLWTAKRRQQLRRDQRPDVGLRFVEHFNVGIVAGLPIAVAAYFWANRLLPVGLDERAAWEMNVLFITWALALLHAALRPAQRAWGEQLVLAATAFGLLPLVNGLTTPLHLLNTLPAADWVLAGFDLTMLALGASFLWAWVLVRRRGAGQSPGTARAGRLTGERTA